MTTEKEKDQRRRNNWIYKNPKEEWEFSSWTVEMVVGIGFYPLSFFITRSTSGWAFKDPKWVPCLEGNHSERSRTHSVTNFSTNTITFTTDELTPDQIAHVKSLQNAVECSGMIIPRLLIDNGLALNVCSVMTLGTIEVEESMICPNGVWCKRLNSAKTAGCPELDLNVLIEREFEVISYYGRHPSCFNLLFRWPWIHTAWAMDHTVLTMDSSLREPSESEIHLGE